MQAGCHSVARGGYMEIKKGKRKFDRECMDQITHLPVSAIVGGAGISGHIGAMCAEGSES